MVVFLRGKGFVFLPAVFFFTAFVDILLHWYGCKSADRHEIAGTVCLCVRTNVLKTWDLCEQSNKQGSNKDSCTLNKTTMSTSPIVSFWIAFQHSPCKDQSRCFRCTLGMITIMILKTWALFTEEIEPHKKKIFSMPLFIYIEQNNYTIKSPQVWILESMPAFLKQKRQDI